MITTNVKNCDKKANKMLFSANALGILSLTFLMKPIAI